MVDTPSLLAIGGQDSPLQRVANEVGLGMQPQFLHHAGTVSLYRTPADIQSLGYIGVGTALGRQLHYFPFPCCQRVKGVHSGFFAFFQVGFNSIFR